jgi:hypothetical protein
MFTTEEKDTVDRRNAEVLRSEEQLIDSFFARARRSEAGR